MAVSFFFDFFLFYEVCFVSGGCLRLLSQPPLNPMFVDISFSYSLLYLHSAGPDTLHGLQSVIVSPFVTFPLHVWIDLLPIMLDLLFVPFLPAR